VDSLAGEFVVNDADGEVTAFVWHIRNQIYLVYIDSQSGDVLPEQHLDFPVRVGYSSNR
jgi:hypothetical protein